MRLGSGYPTQAATHFPASNTSAPIGRTNQPSGTSAFWAIDCIGWPLGQNAQQFRAIQDHGADYHAQARLLRVGHFIGASPVPFIIVNQYASVEREKPRRAQTQIKVDDVFGIDDIAPFPLASAQGLQLRQQIVRNSETIRRFSALKLFHRLSNRRSKFQVIAAAAAGRPTSELPVWPGATSTTCGIPSPGGFPMPG